MDAYGILGIGREADTRQIQLAYRRQARARHPDLGGDVESFLQLQRAYETARAHRARARLVTSGPPRPHDHATTFEPGQSNRYVLAEIAYRFELARPGRTARSFIAAIDAELHPGEAALEVPDDIEAHVAYLISRRTSTALVVAAIVHAIDGCRGAAAPARTSA